MPSTIVKNGVEIDLPSYSTVTEREVFQALDAFETEVGTARIAVRNRVVDDNDVVDVYAL